MNILTIKVRNTGKKLIIFYIYQYGNRDLKYLNSIIEMKVDVFDNHFRTLECHKNYCYFYMGMQYQMKFYFDNKSYITILNV